MDYIIFSLLTMACIGGFMATSYSSLATQRGWPVGTAFLKEISYVKIAGLICQFGSVIISFFIYPWWAAFVIFALGFIGYITLTSFLKAKSQILSIILIIASFILIPIYIFNKPSTNNNIEHFKKSINYSSEGTKISNQGSSFETVDQNTVEKIIEFKRKALSEARLVDTELLNERLDSFGDHYNDEFIKGLETLIKGFEISDQERFLQGQILLDKWETWYSDNIERIKAGK